MASLERVLHDHGLRESSCEGSHDIPGICLGLAGEDERSSCPDGRTLVWVSYDPTLKNWRIFDMNLEELLPLLPPWYGTEAP